MSNKIPERYRTNVAAVVVNEQGLILMCERSDTKNAWQFPQGGIDEGESPEEALFRELSEEIGNNEVQVIGKLDLVIRYEWPEELYVRGFRGQEQIYFLVKLNNSAEIKLQNQEQPEFCNFEWLPLAECLNRLTGFKREPYIQALAELQKLFPAFIATT